VPSWFPADPDSVVVVSGIAELALGAALLGTWKQPAPAVVGGTAAAFFVAVFPEASRNTRVTWTPSA
jgi:uncharacterized membrane protein